MANIISCPTCNKQVSEIANNCPHCGEPSPGAQMNHEINMKTYEYLREHDKSYSPDLFVFVMCAIFLIILFFLTFVL